MQAGEICCRLPVSLPGRRKLIEGMLAEEDLDLFLVDIGGGKPCKYINVAEILFDACSAVGNNELRIPVNLPGSSVTGGFAVHIKMRNLKHIGSSAGSWTPISGSPYLLGEDGSWNSVV